MKTTTLRVLVVAALTLSGLSLAQEAPPADVPQEAPAVMVPASPPPAPVSVPRESRWFGAASYDMAFPFGQASDFGGSFSALGFGLDVRYLFTPNWSAGFSTGWQTFDRKETDPFTLNENVTVQGTQYRYLNAVPLLVTGHYYLRRWVPEWIIPFAGVGIGTYWEERDLDIGVYSMSDSAWHFGWAPEIGVGFRVKQFLPFLRLRYNCILGAGGSDRLPYLNLSLGLAWN